MLCQLLNAFTSAFSSWSFVPCGWVDFSTVFSVLPNGAVEAPGRVELPTNGLGNRCSIHLSYGATSIRLYRIRSGFCMRHTNARWWISQAKRAAPVFRRMVSKLNLPAIPVHHCPGIRECRFLLFENLVLCGICMSVPRYLVTPTRPFQSPK